MKIATWNVERPNANTAKRNEAITAKLREINADILILTETNDCIKLVERYSYHSTNTSTGAMYKSGEKRVAVLSKYAVKEEVETYDSATAKCLSIETPIGKLNVYGTIIGIYGNRRACFKPHLEKQIADWQTISKRGNICVAGDYNISFADNYYYTEAGREKLDSAFNEIAIQNLTAAIPQNIDHIAISKVFIQNKTIATGIWNEGKKLSDHIGVWVEIT